MKVKLFTVRHIKDFIRSLPPNVVAQSFGAKGEEAF